MRVVLGEVVHYAGAPSVQLAATELLSCDVLTGCRPDQWWSAEENRALSADDHRLVTHRRNVGAPRR